MAEYGFSVVLPTYKELENLRRLLPQLIDLFARINKKFEIIVVDDDSGDGTVEFVNTLRQENKPVRIIDRKDERGVATAVITGTNESSLSTIVHMDSDLVHTVDDLEKLITAYEHRKNESTLIIGSRYHPKSIYKGKPLLNRLASSLGRFIVRYYLHLPVKDSSNNFRVFSRELWEKIYPDLITEGNVFFIHILFLAHKQGVKFVEVPTTYIEREIGKSKLNVPKQTVLFFKSIFKDFK